MEEIKMKRKRFAKLFRAYATALYLSKNNPLDSTWVTGAYHATRQPHANNYSDAYKAIRNILDPVMNQN